VYLILNEEFLVYNSASLLAAVPVAAPAAELIARRLYKLPDQAPGVLNTE
jgi:hypothetical protein